MKIIRNRWIPFEGYKAITIGPWIFCKPHTVLTLQEQQHEEIHWEQEKELLIVGFYVLYLLLFVWELLRCCVQMNRGSSPKGHRRSLWKRAYRSIAFEREAYYNEGVQFYVRHRRHYAWLCLP